MRHSFNRTENAAVGLLRINATLDANILKLCQNHTFRCTLLFLTQRMKMLGGFYCFFVLTVLLVGGLGAVGDIFYSD